MLVSYDTDVGATYVELASGEVARTVSVGDLVMVDLDNHGIPIGIEFVVPPQHITPTMLDRLTGAFPELKYLQESRHWLLVSSS